MHNDNAASFNIGVRLRKLRNQRCETLERVANECNVEGSTLSKWEASRTFPGYWSLLDLSRYYDVTIQYLFFGEQNE